MARFVLFLAAATAGLICARRRSCRFLAAALRTRRSWSAASLARVREDVAGLLATGSRM